MRTINLNDLLHPKVGTWSFDNEAMTQTMKQISRAKYKCFDDHIEVIIEVFDERIIIIVDNSLHCYDFRGKISSASPGEPSLNYLSDKMALKERSPLVSALKEYQEENLVSGSDLMDKIWFKFYSPTKIEHAQRDSYHAKWIDYQKQLSNGSKIIYDEFHLNGLWAMPYNLVVGSINSECTEKYGSKLFIVAPVPDCKYLLDGKEIIGDEFRVLYDLDLSKPEDIRTLIEQLSNIQNNISEKNTIERFNKLIDGELSKIDEIRGVNSSYVIRKLLLNGLIEDKGRSDSPGRPLLYGVTAKFLDYFGLGSTKDLPELKAVEVKDDEIIFDTKYQENTSQ